MVRKDRVSVASSSSGRGSQTRSQTKHGEAAVKAVKARQRRKGDDSAYNKNWVAFNEQLYAYGLCLRTIGSDGNCLFRSIADQLSGDQGRHLEYRKQIVDYMERHPLDFAPFVWDETFESYCAKMRQNSTWGGAAELAAASKCFGVNITVHQYNAARLENIYDPLSVTYNPNCTDVPIPVTSDTRTIHLSYHDGEHYSSVRNISDANSLEPATAITIPSGPIAVPGAAAAASSSSSAPLTREEVIVTQSIRCSNLPKIRRLLAESWNDPNAVLEMLYAEQTLGLDVDIDHELVDQLREKELQSQKVELAAVAAAAAAAPEKQPDSSDRRDVSTDESLPSAGPDIPAAPSSNPAVVDSSKSPTDDHSPPLDLPSVTLAAPSTTVTAAPAAVAAAQPPRTKPSHPAPPKRLSGRDKKVAQKQAKMLAEKQKRANKGAVKKERAEAEQAEARLTADFGAVRI